MFWFMISHEVAVLWLDLMGAGEPTSKMVTHSAGKLMLAVGRRL